MKPAHADYADMLTAFDFEVGQSYLAWNFAVVMEGALFTAEAHAQVEQLVPYTGQAYIAHPIAVALVLMAAGRPLEEILAALMHDVPENTRRTVGDVTERFGSVVGRYVEDVTDVSKREDGNRATRKAIDLAHLARASEGGQNVKLGDITVNALTIARRDPVFGKTYLPEKAAQLGVLTKGDTRLMEGAKAAVRAGLELLGRSVAKA